MSAGNRVSGVFAPDFREESSEKLFQEIQFFAISQEVPAVKM
jgi:hypothetical protein